MSEEENKKPATKKVTVTFEVNEDVPQNDFKDWVKTCPHSPEGGQTLVWEKASDQDNTAENQKAVA